MDHLAKLFGSAARVKVLRLFLFNQNSGLTLAEVAERTKLGPSAARAELALLASINLLRRKGTGKNARYAINRSFPHLDALDIFIRETTSVSPARILTMLKKAGALRLVALSGFFNAVVEAQLDLLVVGDHLNERALASTVHALEAELGREIRYASFTTEDFRYRLGVYDRLIRDVFDYPHRLLLDKIGL